MKWFTSFSEERWQTTRAGGYEPPQTRVTRGVPQESPLSPVLFNVYVVPLLPLIESAKVAYHSYADDTRLYLRRETSPTQFTNLLTCLDQIKDWLAANFLQLNAGKTEAIL